MAAGNLGDDGPRYLFDKDGWRLNLLGERPSDDQLERTRQRQFEHDMRAARERWEGGDLTAIGEALRRCHWYQRTPPRWLVEASEVLVERAMTEEEKRARREWNIHFARWEALVELRARRHELRKRSQEPLKYWHKLPERQRELPPEVDNRGDTWESAREAVSEILRNTEAAESARTVKASYELVEAAGGAQATFESFLRERSRRSKPGQDAAD